eukprot:scaffold92243_cov60-Phaeocystis_antarctica.AAC.2
MRCERAWTGCLLNPAEDPLHRGECKVGSDDKLALLWRTVVHVKPYRDGRVRVAARPVPFVVRSILEGVYTPDKGGGRVCCAVAHHARHGARGRGGAHAARWTGLRRHDLKRLICFALRVDSNETNAEPMQGQPAGRRPQPTFHQLLFVSAVARTTRSPSLSSLSQVRAVHSSCHLLPWAAPSSDSHPPPCVRACALPHSGPACVPPEIGAFSHSPALRSVASCSHPILRRLRLPEVRGGVEVVPAGRVHRPACAHHGADAVLERRVRGDRQGHADS